MKDGIWAKRILSCLVCAALVVVCIFCLKKTKPGNVLTTGEINVVKDEKQLGPAEPGMLNLPE